MTAVIVNYCSNKKRFIEPFLKECQKFTHDIIISYGSHLYDGTAEDIDHIHFLEYNFPLVKFVKYKVDLTKQQSCNTIYLRNLARWTAVKNLPKDRANWIFLLDIDELPDGQAVADWLKYALHILKENEYYTLKNYWCFKRCALLIHKIHLTENNIFTNFIGSKTVNNILSIIKYDNQCYN